MDIINSFRIFYFFDIIANDYAQIKFIKRGHGKLHFLNQAGLIKMLDNSFVQKIEIPREDIISKITINFIDCFNDYKNCYSYINSEISSNNMPFTIKIPIIFTALEAKRIGELIIKNASLESKIIKFIISSIFHGYNPSDFLILYYLGKQYQIRIVSIKLSYLTSLITAVVDEASAYYTQAVGTISLFDQTSSEEIRCVILDLPFNVVKSNTEAYLALYLQSDNEQSLYASESGQEYYEIAILNKRTSIGCVTYFENDILNVDCRNFADLVHNGENLAIWGNEIIKFHKWQEIEQNIYQIQEITRGLFETQEFISSHQNYEYFILLEHNPNIIPVSLKLKNKPIFFKIGKQKPLIFSFQNNALL